MKTWNKGFPGQQIGACAKDTSKWRNIFDITNENIFSWNFSVFHSNNNTKIRFSNPKHTAYKPLRLQIRTKTSITRRIHENSSVKVCYICAQATEFYRPLLQAVPFSLATVESSSHLYYTHSFPDTKLSIKIHRGFGKTYRAMQYRSG
jgi:hypothetical protein